MTDINSENYENLISMRNTIEGMIKIHQIEILRILHKNQVCMSENQNGTHINMMEMNPEVLDKIKSYLEYVKYQEKCLNVDEMQKLEYKNTYFDKPI